MNEKLHGRTSERQTMDEHFGALSQLRKENRQIDKIIEKEFETL